MTNKKPKLNSAQLEAVQHVGSPLLVVAGAGSGKTMVITQKIKHIVEEGLAKPENILAISFTNKAAKEMKERLNALLSTATRPYVGTFHAFCGEVLRRHFDRLGGSRQYIIFDTYEQLKLIKQLVKLKQINLRMMSENAVLSTIDRFKNALVTPEEVMDAPFSFGVDPSVAQVYKLYQEKLWQNNAVDFNDLIYYTLKIFTQHPDVLSLYQDKYPFVLVDEYQDTNKAQHQLVQCFAAKTPNVTLVGDFDQNIYSWRGADIQHILNFEDDYENAKVVTLEQNYRSTANILGAANALIKNNVKRKDKVLWTQNNDGHPIMSYTAENEMEEAQYIVNEMRRLKQRGCSLNEMVVLYRMNALSRHFEEALAKDQIPYRLVGGVSFFDRKEIKDVIAYLRLIHNHHDTMSFLRVCNVPNRALGQTSVSKLLEQAEAHDISIYNLVRSGKVDLPSRASKIVNAFFDMIEALRAKQADSSIAELIELILTQTGYREMLEVENTTSSLERLENILELKSFESEADGSLDVFLNKVSLMTDFDQVEETTEAITLMTMHTAKGLEYDFVFICGFEDGIMPHYRSKNSDDELEEERRLCYVGITRGKKKVYLTNCQKRTLFGESRKQASSRFLNEIPKEFITHKSSPTIAERLKSNFEGPKVFEKRKAEELKSLDYQVGDAVQHAVWGQGVITKLDGVGEDAILHLNFEGLEKKLIAKYAPLKKGVETPS